MKGILLRRPFRSAVVVGMADFLTEKAWGCGREEWGESEGGGVGVRLK